MNGVLAMVVVFAATYVICVRLSPAAMRKHADWLNARADAECWFRLRHDDYKKERAERER